MIEKIAAMGVLRNLLHALAVLLMLALPFSAPNWNPQGADVILSAVIPAIAPIVFIVILFDVMMSKIQQSDTEDEEIKKRYGSIIRAHLIIDFFLLMFWLEAFNDALFV